MKPFARKPLAAACGGAEPDAPAAGRADATGEGLRMRLGKRKIPSRLKDFDLQLDRLVETAMRCSTVNIEIAGHTDADGEVAFNQELSERRAQAVTDYLVKAGLPASRFTPVGYGSTQPLAGNNTDEGKAQNRRIDFVVRKGE